MSNNNNKHATKRSGAHRAPRRAMERACRGLAFFLLVLAATACAPLPDLPERPASYALPVEEGRHTTIGQAVATLEEGHPDESGIYSLSDPYEAFAVRALLANAAQRTLDVQYYIWRNDLTGTLLLDSLRQAADRGVRVRFLLDDSANAGIDHLLAALDSHPNIEVRLFNPLALRSPRWINYLVDFSRLNRRMHNKSFTADNQATIIGGRNIGDEYFGATRDILFSDLDVLAVGSVVYDISDDFDRYWNSQSAWPASALLPEPKPDELTRLREKAEAIAAGAPAKAYTDALETSSLMRELLDLSIELEWAPTVMLSDDPRKVLGNVPPEETVAFDLQRYFGNPESHLDLVSSYFVPTETGVRYLVDLAQQGIEIRILTNSLASTDVPAVHAGYAKWRKPLLKAGIKLYETRPDNDPDDSSTGASGKLPSGSGSGSGSGPGPGSGFGLGGKLGSGPGPLGSSGSSLHAKTLTIDDKRVFVGSFNFDPRSAELNTELGFVIDSPRLAQRIHDAFMGQVPQTSYEVVLDNSGKVRWIEYRDGRVLQYDTEPHSSFWRRFWAGFLSLLPIDWML